MQEAQAETGIGDLLTFGFGIGVLSIGLAYFLLIQGEIKDEVGTTSCAARGDAFTSYNASVDLCTNSSGGLVTPSTAEFNATGEGISATAKIPAKLGTIVTVYLAGIIIFFLMRYLYHRVVD